MALLGEMKTVSGSASIPKNPTIVDEHGLRNSISYAAQTPWLQQQSIKVRDHPYSRGLQLLIDVSCHRIILFLNIRLTRNDMMPS